MDPIDAFWHIMNFFAPAVVVGVLAPMLAKLLWWRSLRGVSWARLSRWATGGSALMLIAGLVFFGRDGKMATYGAMVLGCALSLWWVGFSPRRG